MSFSLDLGFRKPNAEPASWPIEVSDLRKRTKGLSIEARDVGGSSDSPDAEPIDLPSPQEAPSPPMGGRAIPYWSLARRPLLWLAVGGGVVAGAVIPLLMLTAEDYVLSLPSEVVSVLRALLLLLGFGVVLGIFATISHALRKSKNPLYWELLSWFLVAIGIILRPFVLDRKDLDIRLSSVAVAGIVAVIVLPLLMRWLNRVKPEPGLIHAALPLSLGVFLDVTQLAAQSYVPKLATYLGL